MFYRFAYYSIRWHWVIYSCIACSLLCVHECIWLNLLCDLLTIFYIIFILITILLVYKRYLCKHSIFHKDHIFYIVFILQFFLCLYLFFSNIWYLLFYLQYEYHLFYCYILYFSIYWKAFCNWICVSMYFSNYIFF